MVSALDVELDQLNVNTTILHNSLDEKIYMSKPKGFIDLKNNHYVC